MVARKYISLARLIPVLILLFISHCGWWIDDFRAIWFIGNAVALLLFSATNRSPYKWVNELVSGYLVGYTIDCIGAWFLEWDESHVGELLILTPLIGYCWRHHRTKAITVAVSSAVAWLIKSIIWMLDKLFL